MREKLESWAALRGSAQKSCICRYRVPPQAERFDSEAGEKFRSVWFLGIDVTQEGK
jgi:hypothetical protein